MREAIEDYSSDFELGYLTIEGVRHDALAEQLEAVHFCFDEAAAMIAAPLLPDGAAKPFERPQHCIAGGSTGAILFSWSSVAANRDDRLCITFGNRGIAVFGIVCANHGDILRTDRWTPIAAAIANMTDQERGTMRRNVVNSMCEVLRDCDDPEIRADCYPV